MLFTAASSTRLQQCIPTDVAPGIYHSNRKRELKMPKTQIESSHSTLHAQASQ